MKVLRCALVVCLVLLFSTFVSAQTQITTGTVQGTAMDTSGAVVPGAKVTVTNKGTNATRELTTDADGRFTALLLQPGIYKVAVSKSGFASATYDNVELTVGQAVTLTPKLGVAGASESVTVNSTPTLDPTKTESSSTINQATVSTTPVLGRKFEDLLTLTPGVSVVQGPDGDEINFNGQRGIFNNVSLDGGDYNNGFFGEQAGGQRAAVDISLEAVQEFQVIASSASAEFGRTAGGIVNVISKSGTNDLHGSIFHFQRLEALSSDTSDGKPLKDFHREQYGATLGGAFVKDKAFGFLAFEQISGNLQRDNLSAQVGSTACPVATPTIQLNEALINSNTDCQRLALLNFIRNNPATSGQEEGLPVRRPVHNSSVLGKLDFNLSQNHHLSGSYNFNASRKVNETFDVATYGNSANGIEGTSMINAINLNLMSTLSSRWVNEGHVTYNRETRPREASPSKVPADTAMGFATTFRFGNPFFLGPKVDETFWRTQIKDNLSWLAGKHNVKLGMDWVHSNNAQVFRGFFEGRYIFDSVSSFLRYASPAAPGGFGPSTVECQTAGGVISYVTLPTPCPAGTTTNGGPLLLYLQGANGNLSKATDAAGASDVNNEDWALFVQDKWQVLPNLTLNYGLRWEAQFMADITTDPTKTVYAPFLNNPAFPSNGTIPDQTMQFQPRVGLAWDVANNQKSVFRMSLGIFNAHQNMLSQVGSVTTNGVSQATIFINTDLIRQGFAPGTPVWPNVVNAAPIPAGTFPLFSGVRVFDRDYHNPRIYTGNAAFEQALAPDWTGYVDFTWSKGVYLTNFLDYNRADRGAPFGPTLGETMVTSSRAHSDYKGVTIGARKRFSKHFQMDTNYTYSRDYDNDSNERDPFTDRSATVFSTTGKFDLWRDWAPSDRDIRHKFNFVIYGEMPWGLEGNMRIQARSAQPITPANRFPAGTAASDLGRNSLRKDNQYSSVDWRLSKNFRFGDRYSLIPTIEMFNTFNSKNNVNPLVSPGLFNFDGYLRQGVGDPRQVQLALKFKF